MIDATYLKARPDLGTLDRPKQAVQDRGAAYPYDVNIAATSLRDMDRDALAHSRGIAKALHVSYFGPEKAASGAMRSLVM